MLIKVGAFPSRIHSHLFRHLVGSGCEDSTHKALKRKVELHGSAASCKAIEWTALFDLKRQQRRVRLTNWSYGFCLSQCARPSELLCEMPVLLLCRLDVEEWKGCWSLAHHEVGHGPHPNVIRL